MKELIITSIGKPRKVRLEDLPFEEQEYFRECEIQPKMFAVDIGVSYDSLDLFPIDVLANLLVEALEENRFENAKAITETIKNKDYTVEITDNKLLLRYEKKIK